MSRLQKKLRNSGLTLVLLGLFSFSVTGQIFTGHRAYNEERVEQGLPPVESTREYLTTGHFVSSVSENMESEFLQMALFVLLTAILIQRGSAESKKPPEEETDEDRAEMKAEEAYSREQRRRHPFLWRFYERSLSLTLFLLFLFFFGLHADGSWKMINEEKARHGEPPISFSEVFSESEFWFESFQNWQSEFFSIAVLGVLSIFLRHKGSPQSKSLRAKAGETSGD